MKSLTFLLTFLALSGTSAAQQSIVDQFEKRSHTLDGFTLPYRLFVPDGYDGSTALPLVLALHGAGERGTDNERQIALHRLATSWADPTNQAVNPAFVVAPQVPPNGRWTADLPVEESDFNREELTTLAILDSLQREFNIDSDRVYITGLSMGGHGTWDLISRLPDRFAAAVPMSGNAYPSQAPKLMHIPIWTFHGESDTVVRPYGARGIVQAMEEMGRNVVYTECRRAPVDRINFDCPGKMPNSELALRIEDHADLIFSAVRNGGHGPWNVWYDHPLLATWLFSKQRVIPDAISIDQPIQGSQWSGLQNVTWTATPVATDSVEVWLSGDNGSSWEHIGNAALEDGSFLIDTAARPDAAVAKVRLFVRNEAGRIYGRDTSDPFTIDNPGDAVPYLSLDDEPLRFEPFVDTETLELRMVAADPERGPLTANVFYSIDGGSSFALASSEPVVSDLEPQMISLDVAALPNSSDAVIRLEISDGVSTAGATTAAFVKQTPRLASDYSEHVAGDGIGTITLHFVDPGNLTDHRYRISFDDSDPAAKTYAVEDLDLGTGVLDGVPLSDGVRESPIFDGMSLVVEDLAVGMPDLERTGWIAGESDLGVSIVGGSVMISILRFQLLETDDEYEIRITDSVADTSVAMYAIPSEEVYFSVTGRSDGERRKILFKDAGKDGRLGDGDVLYILEEDPEGELAPAWEFRFTATAGTVLPVAGDTFLFVPLSKLGSDDLFEFVATIGVDVDEPQAAPDLALSTYPNPLSERSTISFSLPTPSHVALRVYDLLGRVVAVPLEETVSAGRHRINWGARRGDGARLAAGYYVVRLTAHPVDGGSTLTSVNGIFLIR